MRVISEGPFLKDSCKVNQFNIDLRFFCSQIKYNLNKQYANVIYIKDKFIISHFVRKKTYYLPYAIYSTI